MIRPLEAAGVGVGAFDGPEEFECTDEADIDGDLPSFDIRRTPRLLLPVWYEELREFIVLVLESSGRSASLIEALSFADKLARISSFIAFFAALSSTPGHFAGTFISHLIWHENPQSVHVHPLVDNPQIFSPQRSQPVGILKLVDLKLCALDPLDRSPAVLIIVSISTCAVNNFPESGRISSCVYIKA